MFSLQLILGLKSQLEIRSETVRTVNSKIVTVAPLPKPGVIPMIKMSIK